MFWSHRNPWTMDGVNEISPVFIFRITSTLGIRLIWYCSKRSKTWVTTLEISLIITFSPLERGTGLNSSVNFVSLEFPNNTLWMLLAVFCFVGCEMSRVGWVLLSHPEGFNSGSHVDGFVLQKRKLWIKWIDEVTLTLGAVVTSSHRVDKHLMKRILSVEFLGIPPCFQKGAVVETGSRPTASAWKG